MIRIAPKSRKLTRKTPTTSIANDARYWNCDRIRAVTSRR
jgi:hypothetical protein